MTPEINEDLNIQGKMIAMGYSLESKEYYELKKEVRDGLKRAYLKGMKTQAAQINGMHKDCKVMAAWFKDLIEDHYGFSGEEIPAYNAALKYIDPKELTLLVFSEKPVQALTNKGEK